MIQRIQTVYLTVVTILASMFAFFNEYAIVLWQKFGAAAISSSLVAIVSSLLAFITIFLFKNRKAQMRLISFNFLIILIGISLYVWKDGLSEFYKDWTFYLLLLAIGALLMARKGVKADDDLIRSSNRLR